MRRPPVLWVGRSGNAKTGAMPCVYVSRETCPQSCPLRPCGCYALSGPVSWHWARSGRGARSTWSDMLRAVAALEPGTVWRYAVAGDLPGRGDSVDLEALAELVRANRGRRGYTYTHKPLTAETVRALRAALKEGFVVNVSCETLPQAVHARALGLPAAAIVPRTYPERGTVAGCRVVVCPHDTGRAEHCTECRLCATGDRSAIVAFRPRGRSAAQVEALCAGAGHEA